MLKNQWYVAAWDYEVDRNPLARTLCEIPVMLYRKLNRTVVAMQDACPHRLLPLSMGLREGDKIRCRYHGLLLDADGSALEMPLKTDKVNKGICAKTYPVVERHRFVWIWMGDADLADPDLIPDFWPCSKDGWAFDGGYNHVSADYRLIIDNLMDLTHETHVHASSIGQNEIMEAPLEVTQDGNSVFVSRWMPNLQPPPFWRDALKQDVPVDRWQICQYVAPSNVIIDVGVAPVGAGATWQDHDMGVRAFVIDALTPESGNKTHYFWGLARNFDVDDKGFTARFRAQQAGVFREDIEVLEAQQRSIEANPEMKLRAFNIDQGGTKSRLAISRMARA
ncbi:MAG: Rieske (2Fe-2S) protein [Stutzerimonas stutzeri]|nr:MAG: Rieske (2Fe-2S) protein [Stutzerimonas stutzeri]